jgi:hypothetical protein
MEYSSSGDDSKKLVNKFLAFYTTRRFITVFMKPATDPYPGSLQATPHPTPRPLPSMFPSRLQICVRLSFLPYTLQVPFVSSVSIL